MADVKNFAVNPEPELIKQIDKFANSEAYKDCTIRIMPDGHADCNRYFDVIVMPCVDRTKAKKE